jgi:hypothetical protein
MTQLSFNSLLLMLLLLLLILILFLFAYKLYKKLWIINRTHLEFVQSS